MPTYAKSHSYGEYVFDWGWAEAYRRHGRRYYPKLLCAVPFTPVSGPRILARHAPVRRAMLVHALELVRRHKFSTLHVLFLPEDEAREGEALGMIPRAGMQFHWTNEGYRVRDGGRRESAGQNHRPGEPGSRIPRERRLERRAAAARGVRHPRLHQDGIGVGSHSARISEWQPAVPQLRELASDSSSKAPPVSVRAKLGAKGRSLP